ncbi:hypothetical protein N9H50_00200, partial [bacterium]|nr:hypothetical protein [bacterium]
MIYRNLIFKRALWCFLLFLALGTSLFAQSQSDSLIFDFPDTNPWDSPLEEPSSGFYLSNPSFLQPTIEYDPESRLYSVEHQNNGLRLSNASYLTFDEYNDYNISKSI